MRIHWNALAKLETAADLWKSSNLFSMMKNYIQVVAIDITMDRAHK